MKRCFRWCWMVTGGALLLSGVGCWRPPAPTMIQQERGVVWMFPGMSGQPWHLQAAYQGFRDAGVDDAIRIYEWDTPVYRSFSHLMDLEHNRELAGRVADEIVRYRARYPEQGVDLVGYSAGGGIAILVAEALPEEVRLDQVVLVQAAVSPTYDLTAALERIDGRLVNIYCASDWFILGWGTEMFGTVNRQKTESAGKVGFDLDVAVASDDLRHKVVQRKWTAEMLKSFHMGDHAGILSYYWNRDVVAPYLLAAAPDAVVDEVTQPAESGLRQAGDVGVGEVVDEE